MKKIIFVSSIIAMMLSGCWCCWGPFGPGPYGGGGPGSEMHGGPGGGPH